MTSLCGASRVKSVIDTYPFMKYLLKNYAGLTIQGSDANNLFTELITSCFQMREGSVVESTSAILIYFLVPFSAEKNVIKYYKSQHLKGNTQQF